MNNILIIGAHFDDAELGAGATAAKLVALGKRVYKITLTNTRVVSKDMNLNILEETGRENSRNACSILGVEEILIKNVSEFGRLQYNKDIMQEIEHIIFEKNIDTVLFHFGSDYQTDHLEAHKICKTAARHCKNLLMFQSNPYIISEAFYPNVFIDVTDFIELKRKALECYEADHNRQGNLFETNIDRNKIWGYGNHCGYSEGFVAIKLNLD